MIDVRVSMSRPLDQDAIAIQVIGYDRGEDNVVQAYQGFPDTLNTIDELSGSFHANGWLWQPVNSGDILEPSMIFPGIWTHGIEEAMRAFSGINESKIAAAFAMSKRTEDRLDDLIDRVNSVDNAAANMGSMAAEAKNLAQEAITRIGRLDGGGTVNAEQ